MTNFETIINNIRDILRNEGITGMDSINHCISFIMLRFLTIEKCEYFSIPIKYAYDNFLIDENTNKPYQKNDQRILSKFYSDNIGDEDLVDEFRNKFNFTQLIFKMTSPYYFFDIFSKLGQIDISHISEQYDVVGMIYEIHLKSGTSNSMRDLGQYFTHRKVIKFMIDLCDPKLKSDQTIETILDPSMGTGGFLSMSIKHLNNKYSDIDWEHNKSNIYGFDIDENVRNLALLNILIESGKLCDQNLVKNDTLKCDYTLDHKTIIQNVDIILANEPFGLKSLKYKDCCKRIKDLKIEGTKSEPLFLQLMLKSLNPNGRCAVIVPDGVLFNEASLHSETRKYLIENLNLKKVISLGDKLFLNTGVKSSILYFVNDGQTETTEFSTIKLLNGEIIETNIINASYDDLVKNKYNLSVNKYIKLDVNESYNIEYKKLSEICTFLPKSKKSASYGSDNGKYPFFTSSNVLNKYSDEADYNERCLIFGTGGNANIKIGENFSCSADNFIIRSQYDKYIYYWFKSNMNKLEELFHGSTIKHLSKTDLENIEIPIPSIEVQNRIIQHHELIYNSIDLQNN